MVSVYHQRQTLITSLFITDGVIICTTSK